jgi:hypothetical protein
VAASVPSAERPALSLAELDAYDPHPGGAGAERRYCCPLDVCRGKPIDRQHQSLCVNVESGAWICNRCGATGKLRERWEDGPSRLLSLRERRRQAFARSLVIRHAPAPGRSSSTPLLPALLARCRPLAGSVGQRYLFDRGIGLGVAARAGVLYTGDCYGRPAVVFPLHDQSGQLVALHARHTDGRTDPKCHTVGDRRLGAFATQGALAAGAPLVVVEGPCDALALATCDVPAVALVATTAPRWLRVVAGFRRVLVALDADARPLRQERGAPAPPLGEGLERRPARRLPRPV